MPAKFQMVDVDFGKDVEADIARYVEENIEALESGLNNLHQQKIPKWRKLYLGTPAEESRNFPFPNAANTVVQVIGESVDTMVARVLGLVWATHPAWVFQNYMKVAKDDKGANSHNEDVRRTLEDFLDLVGYDPHQLDLYRIESQWFTDAARLGTSYVKIGIENQTEAVVVGYNEAKRIQGKEETIYEGPRIHKLRHEDVLISGDAPTVEQAGFVAIRCTLKRIDLEDRKFTDTYNRKVVDEMLKSPDRTSPREQTAEELRQQGINPPTRPHATAEWEVYECYFPWWHNGRKFRLIYSYHKRSKSVLRKVFNFLPKNSTPLVRAKRGYNTDGQYGHGYAELLEIYQEELSTTHNQRLDNATVANVRALRISPRARALDTNTELYPSALLIGEKDEIESIQVGDVYPSTFKNEEMTLGLAARRVGISPAVSGAGTGGMMKKPAVYSSQGTLAVMQENNTVVGHATSEFRHSHVILGAKLAAIYGKFGTGGREEMFGLDKDKLLQALALFEQGHMQIPIRSSNGSLNKEVDKQTGMLMAGVLQRHYTAVGQVLQAISNPMIPANVRDYLVREIEASILLHKRIVKDFGYEQPDIYVPEVELEEQGQQPNPGKGPQGGMAAGRASMAGAGAAPGGGGGGPVPAPGLGGPEGGPTPFAGPSGGGR